MRRATISAAYTRNSMTVSAGPAGRGSAPCYINFHKDDDVNQRRRIERWEPSLFG
jgi:hypothetical protein